jgi:hypothetical protein
MVIAITTVMTAPMITASHAVTRMMANNTSNKTSGSSATSAAQHGVQGVELLS